MESIRCNLEYVWCAKFNYSASDKVINAPEEKLGVSFDVKPVVNFDIEDEFIIIDLISKINHVMTKELIVESRYIFNYKVKDFKDFVRYNNKTKKFTFKNKANDEIVHSLVGSSVSFYRGVLFEKLRGTFLEDTIIPLLSLKTTSYK